MLHIYHDYFGYLSCIVQTSHCTLPLYERCIIVCNKYIHIKALEKLQEELTALNRLDSHIVLYTEKSRQAIQTSFLWEFSLLGGRAMQRYIIDVRITKAQKYFREE